MTAGEPKKISQKYSSSKIQQVGNVFLNSESIFRGQERMVSLMNFHMPLVMVSKFNLYWIYYGEETKHLGTKW